MQILGPNATVSAAFIVAAGKQVTLSAHGLSDNDVVVIEIVTLSSAPEFKGDPCCDLQKANIEVISAVPLKCPDGSLVTLTAEYPFVVLDGPQMVTMRARLIADADATVTVDLNESDSDGCTLCACRTKPCEDTSWSPTGDERCVGTNVEREEVSNCGTPRWVVDRPQTWTATGDERCNNSFVEKEEVNDCGKTRWVPTTVACGFCPSYPVPMDQCDGQRAFGFREGDARDPAATVVITDCDGGNKIYFYPAAGPGHSVPVTECDGTLIGYGANVSECASDMPLRIESLPCLEICSIPDLVVSKLPVVELKKQVVSSQIVCGELWYIWSDGTKTTETLPVCPVPVVYCPSMRLSCDGQPGFGFHLMDPKDPAATVEMAPCSGDTSTDSIWIYPSAGPGHTIKVADCDGVAIGYAANQSDCAADCGCPKDPVITVNVAAPTVNVAAPEVTVTPVNNFAPTTNVAAPEVTAVNNITLPAPNLVAHALSDTGVLTSTLSNGQTVVSNPLPSC